MQQYTDAQILSLLSSTDEEKNDQGLRALYRLYFPMVSQLIQNNSGTVEDVEDVFQDGILVLYNQIKNDRLKLSCALKTYFYSICRNLWLKKLNRNRLKTVDINDQLIFIPVEASIFRSIELNEEKEVMLELLGRLGEDCQKMLLHFYYECLQMEEIAHRMNFANAQVARNKKVKCLRQLTNILDSSPFFKQFFK